MKRQCRLDTDYDEVSNTYSKDFEVRLNYSVNPILAFYQYLSILMNIIKHISEIHIVTIIRMNLSFITIYIVHICIKI